MSIEIAYPFRLNNNGQVQQTSNPAVMQGQHLRSLISTQPGERVMMPGYGVDTIGRVFAPVSEVVDVTLVNDIIGACKTWEPNINVTSVAPAPNNQPLIGEIALTVNWTTSNVTGNASGVQTATVLVGGTVIED
jgi:hypothetical protein